MSVFTTLKLAIRALWRNKVRSMLTMLGIVFGIGAVIAMVAGGQGAQQAVTDVFRAWAPTCCIVTNGSQRSFGAAGGAGSRQSLTWDDLDGARERRDPDASRWVAPVLQTKAQVASEDANWNTRSSARPRSGSRSGTGTPTQGAVFDEDAGNSNAKIAVIGKTVATQLYGTANPIGQTIRINGQPYEVIGVLDRKGQGPMGDHDDIVVIPVKTYQQKLDEGPRQVHHRARCWSR